jgi:alanine racemase
MNKAHSQIGYRPTWAEVNLGNLEYNFRQVKKLIAGQTKVMVTVKADAYGHGLIPVSKKLVACGVDYLGVASIDEGIKLRQANINVPILVLGIVLKNDITALFKYCLVSNICTYDFALALNNQAAKYGKRVKAHIKVDTGMGRLGALPDDAFDLVSKIRKLNFIDIEGLFTHFAFADTNRKFTNYQITLFNRLIGRLDKSGLRIPLLHAANSMGVLDYKHGHFNMVRPGLFIYGLYPKKNLNIILKAVLSLKSKVTYAKKVPKGYGISYGHEYITKRQTQIVTLPIGYGDGYPRNLSNKGPVLIRGKRFIVSGRVCMDQIMVDVRNLPVRIGDEVVLIGSQGKKKVTTEELAMLCGTIPYEIVCGLGSRIPRIYT